MTSNLGVKKMQEFGSGIGFSKSNNVYANEEVKKNMLNKELKTYFAPEFINRLDEIIVFNTLQNEDVKKIVMVEMTKLTNRLNSLGYKINFDDSVIDFISNVGFDEVYGARPLKRAIQEKLEDFISDEVLKGTVENEKEYNVFMKDDNVQIEEIKKKKSVKKKKGE